MGARHAGSAAAAPARSRRRVGADRGHRAGHRARPALERRAGQRRAGQVGVGRLRGGVRRRAGGRRGAGGRRLAHPAPRRSAAMVHARPAARAAAGARPAAAHHHRRAGPALTVAPAVAPGPGRARIGRGAEAAARMARPLSARSPLLRPAGVALVVGVTLAHLWLSDELMEDRLGFGAAQQQMRRIEVSYVRELAVAPPPAAPAPAPRAVKRPRRAAVAKAPASASAPQDAAQASAPVVARAEPPPAAAEPPAPPAPKSEPAPPVALGSDPTASAPDAAPAVAPSAPTAQAAAAPPAASAPTFDWPPSTRLSYGLVGYY